MTREEKLADALTLVLRNIGEDRESLGSLHLAVLHARGVLNEVSKSKPTLPVGVSVLVLREGKVLMGRRKNNTAAGLWSTPGGRVEQDEDLYHCAIRETCEETGLELTCLNLRWIATREHFRYGNHYVMFYVKAEGFPGDPENKEPDKCEGWEWVSIPDALARGTTEPWDVLEILTAGALTKPINREVDADRYQQMLAEPLEGARLIGHTIYDMEKGTSKFERVTEPPVNTATDNLRTNPYEIPRVAGNPMIGKTISEVSQSYDNAQLHEIEIKFTDGTFVSLMNIIHPDIQATYYAGDKDEDLTEFKIEESS